MLAQLKGRGKGITTIAHSPIANAVMFDTTYTVTKVNGLATIS